MKKYRIIAGLSAAVLALGLLTACGKKQETPEPEKPTIQEDAAPETTPETTPETAPETEPEQDPVETPEEGEPDPIEPEDPEAELPTEQTILVAELTEIAGDGSMTILPYAQAEEAGETVIEDFANVDFSAFTAGEQTQELVLSEGAVLHSAVDGQLVEADAEALTVGAMLVIATDADGNQTITIYAPAA